MEKFLTVVDETEKLLDSMESLSDNKKEMFRFLGKGICDNRTGMIKNYLSVKTLTEKVEQLETIIKNNNKLIKDCEKEVLYKRTRDILNEKLHPIKTELDKLFYLVNNGDYDELFDLLEQDNFFGTLKTLANLTTNEKTTLQCDLVGQWQHNQHLELEKASF
jgi:tetrahydromethanopterin S-methyltransferase subunit B